MGPTHLPYMDGNENVYSQLTAGKRENQWQFIICNSQFRKSNMRDLFFTTVSAAINKSIPYIPFYQHSLIFPVRVVCNYDYHV